MEAIRCDEVEGPGLLEAYTDPETGMSGREVLEELLDRGDYDARRRLQAKEVAGRMLADPDPTA